MKSSHPDGTPLIQSQYLICIYLDISNLLQGLLYRFPIFTPLYLKISHYFPLIGLVPVAEVVEDFFPDGRSKFSFSSVVMAPAVCLRLQFQIRLREYRSRLTHIHTILRSETNHSSRFSKASQ